MPRRVIRARTCSPVNRLVRLAAGSLAFRTPAICGVTARGGEPGDAGEQGGVVGQLVQPGDGADGPPGALVTAAQVMTTSTSSLSPATVAVMSG